MYNHENYWDVGAKRRGGPKRPALAFGRGAERQLKGWIAVIGIDLQLTSVNWSTRILGRAVG